MELKTRVFKDVLSYIGCMCAESVAVAQEDDGWHIMLVEPSHISAMSVLVPAACFADYAPGAPFAFSPEEVRRAVRCMDGDTVRVEVGDRFVVSSGGTEAAMPLMDTRPLPPTAMPDLALPAVAITDGEWARRLLAVNGGRAHSMRIAVFPGGLRASAEDDTGRSAQVELPASSCIACEGEASASYPCDMWESFLKAVPRGATLEMRMGDRMPVEVSFGEAVFKGKWMLAPWIESPQEAS